MAFKTSQVAFEENALDDSCSLQQQNPSEQLHLKVNLPPSLTSGISPWPASLASLASLTPPPGAPGWRHTSHTWAGTEEQRSWPIYGC